MLFELDLWDYDAVKTHSTEILRKVKGPDPNSGGTTMPTIETGGPWPSVWVSVFDRWIQGGYRRILLGTAWDLKLVDLTVGICIVYLGYEKHVTDTNSN